MEDKQLIFALQNNPDEGFKQLLQLYQKPIYFYVRKMVFSHDDAHDVTQNVWIKVFKNIKNFRNESKLSTWLYRIATNETLSFITKEAKKNKTTLEEMNLQKASMLSTDTLFDGNEIELMLQKTLATLPPKQKMVFQLKYYENKKYEEISEILDTSVGALKASYHHATQKIKAQLQHAIL